MVVQVSDEPRITGNIGGQPKTKYFTPDGLIIRAMPDIHEYAQKDDIGKVISSGLRDANLDKGWLTQKPTTLMLYCPHCDLWHATTKDIDQCGAKRKALYSKHGKLAKRELGKSDSRINKLESDIAEIKGLLNRLLNKEE